LDTRSAAPYPRHYGLREGSKMSGIDLWDDDLSGASTTLEAPPLLICLIAADDQHAFWHEGLASHGISFCDTHEDECQLILVDERCPDHLQRLANLPTGEDQRRPPVFFLVNNGAEPDCMRAFSAGADDYVHLPISPEALAARLKRAMLQLHDSVNIRQQLMASSTIAFQSMSMNAELGRILHFMQASFTCQEYATLAELALQMLNELGLNASLGIFHDRGLEYFCDDGIKRPIEQEVIENSRHLGRISDFGARTILNYPHFGLLIRNMPVEDPLRYGILKDHICYLGNGLEARCQAMIIERSANERAVRIQATAAVLQRMIAEMEQAKLEVTRTSTAELQGMLDNLQCAFSNLSLTGPEEDVLANLLTESGDRIHALFKSAAEQDKLFQALLCRVTKTLER
jgi:DNA-binding NarL/FixJ family response regulator